MINKKQSKNEIEESKSNKFNKRNKFLQIFGFILIFIGVFGFGFLACSLYVNNQQFNWRSESSQIPAHFSFKPTETITSEQDIINNCKNLSLVYTSQCLIENVATIYKYSVTDDKLNLTFEDIIKKGGDCRDYAFLYERLSKELGFNATTNTYNGIPNVHNAHRWAEVWDETDYCELDLKQVNCYKIDYTINNGGKTDGKS